MKNKLKELKEEILQKIKDVKESDSLKDIEIKYLGRKGELTKILKGISELKDDEKKKIGKLANEIKIDVQNALKNLKDKIDSSQRVDNLVDVTLPGKKVKNGSISPITLVQNDLEDLFESMGFLVLDGPELESDFFNFEALNIPKNHPARDMQDTFYIDRKNDKGDYDMVMRTHTSPMQVRAMRKYGAPLRCVVPGRVFRNEATDATHDTTFDQIEGLMIGEGISISNLISVLKEMLSGIFEKDVKIRVRPGYFPFVEPGIEIDMACRICGGAKCPSCKNTGWLEMLGAGMVHPNVLKHGGIDSEKYTGFAFGLGATRLAMMKYGIDDIRLFNSGDLRFLKQF